MKIILNALIILLCLTCGACVALGLAGSIVQSDLTDTEQVMERLEQQQILHDPPDNISNDVKADIKIFGSSAELEAYLIANEKNIARTFQMALWLFVILIALGTVRLLVFKKK